MYQHFTNAIENFFSVLKSKLKKLDNLSYKEINDNIIKSIKEIPKEHYYNIFKGAYVRDKENDKKKYKANNS